MSSGRLGRPLARRDEPNQQRLNLQAGDKVTGCKEFECQRLIPPFVLVDKGRAMELMNLTVKELLQLLASATDELRTRNIVRTNNNPLGDYTEWLVARAFRLELQTNSKAGYDGVRKAGIDDELRVQIKGRRVTPGDKTWQLSAIRNYASNDFDVLVAVIFDERFNIIEAFWIPHAVIGDYASYRAHVNAHILSLRSSIMTDSRVESVKDILVRFHQ